MIYRPKTLVIVRHAESLWNAYSGKERGTLKKVPPELKDIPDHKTPLSEAGKKQAVITGEALAKQFGEFDTVYYSPWRRTKDTGQIILEQFSTCARKRMQERFFGNLFIIEQSFGDLDIGISNPQDLRKAYDEFYRKRRMIGKFYTPTPNGESWWHVCMRTHDFLEILFRPNRNGQKILIITHGVTMQTFRYHLERIDEDTLVESYQKDKCRNCGVSWYEWDGRRTDSSGQYILRFWNKIFYQT